ncbi:MAG: ATP-dependent DNA helicase [Acidimicrobiales bacterium]
MLTDQVTTKLEEVTVRLPGGGQHRAGQVELARAVSQAISDRFHLVARAGTGTGKSLAYLVPAIMSGQRTVVATATKALQDQLANKDLPFLGEHLDFTWAVLKGRSNYVCRQRLVEIANDRQLALDGVAGDDFDQELDAIVEWSEDTETGDRAELAAEPRTTTWSAVSVTSDTCPGATRCPSGEECFAEWARAEAQVADLVVVNTHLYGLNLASDGVILPEHDVVVIDEAHQLEDIISATAGVEISAGRFHDLARRSSGIIVDDELSKKLSEVGDDVDLALEGLGDGRVHDVTDGELGRAISGGRELADRLLAALRNISNTTDADLAARKERAQQSATTLIAEIDRAHSVTTSEVAYVTGPPSRRSLRIAPIDVGETLQDSLWKIPTVILTSATIPEVMPEQIGLGPDAFEFVDVGSPFDYEHSALLYCANQLPEPRSEEFEEASQAELERLIIAAGGRTLALFTSWRAMQNAVEALRPRLPWEVLAQGELPKPLLLDEFRDDPESCLFATLSFWQGVDVVGSSLSLLTIDKLPFPRPDDPLLEARRERAGRGAFRKVDLPRAAMMLAQGTGRLIRSESDQGVVAILDRRLATAKNYRWDLIEALPPYRRTADREEAETFLRRLRDA